MLYKFASQLKIGQTQESYLDSVFRHQYEITPASASEQRMGIDRWFKHRETGQRFSVEYKFDRKASSTGRAFIETVSVDARHVPGWVYTTQAVFVLIYVPIDELVYVIRERKLRNKIEQWKIEYGERKVNNGTYHTRGVCVPLSQLEKIAESVVSL